MKKQELLLVQLFCASLIIMGGAYLLRAHTLPPQIPLFYSLAIGGDTVTNTYFIFLLPIVSFCIVLTNTLLYNRLFKDDLFVRKILYYASVCAIITLTYIFLKIILLVT